MLSISIRYGGKLSYAMRALGPMLGSNSRQAETALGQVFGHDGASRHTLLSKMLRHNSARAQNHSDTSIDLRQRSCAAVCDMFLGKNHGSHFITIKSIGKTHHPVPLRFAVNGSASARYASLATALDKPLLHVAAEQHVNAMQHAMSEPPAKTLQHRGSNGIRTCTCTCACSCSARSAAIRINGDIQCPKLRSAASPKAPRHRRDRLT